MEYTQENPLRLIELFAGIGSQTQALKNVGVPHTVVAISEIDKNAIKSYTALHGETVNLGDIKEIRELPEADFWTYSFPCQDISVAGHGAGIKEGTRSGLLLEVERLLKVAAEKGTLPKYLLLENVKNLVSKKFKADFDSWLSFLSSLGYTNYWQVLNAKDYGIPQHRERVFCVSIRGEHTAFVFPEKRELTLRLKDMIDEHVDERYYLKESTIRSIVTSKFNSRRDSIRRPSDYAYCLRARDCYEPQCVQVGDVVGEKWEKMHEMSRRVFQTDGISPTVHCAGGGNTELKIVALVSTLLPEEMLRDYDAQITLYDRAEAIKQTILKLVETQEDTEADDEPQSLSAREKEIVVCVVKGMTNREIADRLYLSTHTVITHRRNIARKLQIHSASGLTIYAIVNKLVELGDIQQVKPQM